jgi:site-specific recombinase XerD
MTALATTLQAFFTDRMARQRQVGPNTLAAYRDALRLLLVFATDKKGKEPSKLDIDDLDAPLISAFLDDLEHQRKNGARTRNARLAAIRSLFRYAALRHPDHAALIARVLVIPSKRFDRRLVTFLTEPEISALLAAPDRSTWTGRRELYGACGNLNTKLPEGFTIKPCDKAPCIERRLFRRGDAR